MTPDNKYEYKGYRLGRKREEGGKYLTSWISCISFHLLSLASYYGRKMKHPFPFLKELICTSCIQKNVIQTDTLQRGRAVIAT